MLVSFPLSHDLRLGLPEDFISVLMQHDLKKMQHDLKEIFHSNQKTKSLAIYAIAALKRRREHENFGVKSKSIVRKVKEGGTAAMDIM